MSWWLMPKKSQHSPSGLPPVAGGLSPAIRAPGGAGLVLASSAGRWVVLATILCSALAGIDATVATIALPAMRRDLDASFAGLQWTITGDTIPLASLILLGGVAGDRCGLRRMSPVGTTWFTAASLLCAVAPTAQVLVTTRVLQRGLDGSRQPR